MDVTFEYRFINFTLTYFQRGGADARFALNTPIDGYA